MKDWFLSQGWQLLALSLPFVISNKLVYKWTRATIGKLISFLTVKTASHPAKALLGWLFNTLAAFASGISDEVRGIPAMEDAGGQHVVERLNGHAVPPPTPPPGNPVTT